MTPARGTSLLRTPREQGSTARSIHLEWPPTARAKPRSAPPQSIRPRSGAEIHPCSDTSALAGPSGQLFQSEAPPESHPQSTPDLAAGDSARDLQKFQRRRAPEKWRRRPPALRGCSSDRRRGERPPHSQPRQHSAVGIFSKTSSAIHAIGNPAQDIFNRPSAEVGAKLIQRPVAA